jgi:hypothetical protein
MPKRKSERVKAVELAIKALEERRHKFAVSASASRYNLPFGIIAQAKVDEHNRAIAILQTLLAIWLTME